jgi:hypothetical protein
MYAHLAPTSSRLELPVYVWLAVVIELFTAVLAIPVGWMFITDPSGGSMGVPQSWIADTIFGSYLIPGLYLFVVNGIGMLVVAGLSLRRHWSASWLTGALGVGLIVWIIVQLAVMPETMVLQWLFLAAGLILGFVALFWLRRTDQLRLW